jgi:hypothetical protein
MGSGGGDMISIGLHEYAYRLTKKGTLQTMDSGPVGVDEARAVARHGTRAAKVSIGARDPAPSVLAGHGFAVDGSGGNGSDFLPARSSGREG